MVLMNIVGVLNYRKIERKMKCSSLKYSDKNPRDRSDLPYIIHINSRFFQFLSMHVFYTSKHLLHDEITPCYNSNQYCEKIDRVENILKTLQSYDQFTIISTTESSDLKPLPSTLTKDFGVEPILEIHSKELYNYLETAFEEWTKRGNVGGIIPSTYPHSRYIPQINGKY